MALPLFDCIFLACMVIGAATELNAMEKPPWCLRVGLALVIGGSAGIAAEWYMPNVTQYWADVTLHAGGALTLVALTRDKLRAFFVQDWRRSVQRFRVLGAGILAALRMRRVS